MVTLKLILFVSISSIKELRGRFFFNFFFNALSGAKGGTAWACFPNTRAVKGSEDISLMRGKFGLREWSCERATGALSRRQGNSLSPFVLSPGIYRFIGTIVTKFSFFRQ